MCHSTDSRPPGVAEPGTVAAAESLELTSPDGTLFSAFHASPGQPNGRGVVILPDVRGFHPYYEALARRFAEAGFAAVVLDYYGRTAGLGPRDDAFDWQQHRAGITPATVVADVGTALDFLTARHPGVAVFSVGFCMGGGYSWRMAGEGLGLSGSIGFYGIPALAAKRVDSFTAPLLMLLAGADEATSPADFDSFRSRLDAAGKTYEDTTYEGAPHSFFDHATEEWRDVNADAWRRIQDFTARYAA